MQRPGTTAIRHHHPPPSSKRGSGIWYLFPSYKEIGHRPIPANARGLTNAGVSGMLWRQTWNCIQPSLDDDYDWSYLDDCFDQSDEHGKLASLQILAGTDAPDDFFTRPEAKFINITGVGPTTVPWDSDFQAYWFGLNNAMAIRYGSNPLLHHIVMSGIGHASESFLAIQPEEITQARALAVSMGYADEVEAWRTGVQFMIDMYAQIWSKPFTLVTGAPFGSSSTEALQAMYDYGDGNYRAKFSARADDLTARNPTVGQISYDVIKSLGPHSVGTGYQAGNAQTTNDPNPPTRLRAMLQLAYDIGANYVEPFALDTDTDINQSTIAEFNTKFKSR